MMDELAPQAVGPAVPRNEEAEQQLLGAILVNNAAYEAARPYVDSRAFYDPAHGKLFAEMGRLIEQGRSVTPTVIAPFAATVSELDEVGGGRTYVAELAAAVVSVVDAGDHARHIADLYQRRRLLDACDDAQAAARDYSRSAEDLIAEIDHSLTAIADQGGHSDGLVALGEATAAVATRSLEVWRGERAASGLPTGFADIDRKTGGLHPGELVILAGRPAMGKSALAENIGYRIAERTARHGGGARVYFVSVEMPAAQLAERRLADVTGIPVERQRAGRLDAEEAETLDAAAANLRRLPIVLDESSQGATALIRARARRMARRHGLSLIIVDYLQLLSATGRPDNRTAALAQITAELKSVARECACPMLLVSQLSRAVEQRDDKRPKLADLRESGAIEQDADLVGFVFREEYYLAQADPQKKDNESDEAFNKRWYRWAERLRQVRGTAELIVAKQRQGEPTTVPLAWDGPRQRFDNLAHERGLP